MSHPSLEDEAVQAGLVDDNGLALVVRTSPLNQGSGFVLGFDVSSDSVFGLCVPQCLGHVLADKPAAGGRSNKERTKRKSGKSSC